MSSNNLLLTSTEVSKLYEIACRLSTETIGIDYFGNVYVYVGRTNLKCLDNNYLLIYIIKSGEETKQKETVQSFYILDEYVIIQDFVVCGENHQKENLTVHFLSRKMIDGEPVMIFLDEVSGRSALMPTQNSIENIV